MEKSKIEKAMKRRYDLVEGLLFFKISLLMYCWEYLQMNMFANIWSMNLVDAVSDMFDGLIM